MTVRSQEYRELWIIRALQFVERGEESDPRREAKMLWKKAPGSMTWDPNGFLVSFLRSNCLADFQEILMITYYTYTSIILNIFIIDSLWLEATRCASASHTEAAKLARKLIL